jgi:phosphoglycerate dehydrogenase-like enzyme
MAKAKGRAVKPTLHINNDPGEATVFHISQAQLQAASRKHKGLLQRINVTWSNGAQGYEAGLRDADILLASHFDAKDLARRAPGLKWVQVTSAGVEKLAPLIPPGVLLTNASGVHSPKGGEFAMTGVLMLSHGIPRFATGKEQGRWEQNFTTGVEGKTVVIVGVGAIGGEVARLAKRFAMKVIGVSRSGAANRHVDRMVKQRDLAKVLPLADFLVGALPLTVETRGLIGRAELDLLPRHCGIVNAGRSGVIDYEAMREKLELGTLAGAVLDVFDNEPLPPDSPWWKTPNTIITAHSAVDDGVRYIPRCLDIFFDNLGRHLSGRKLRNIVDLTIGY